MQVNFAGEKEKPSLAKKLLRPGGVSLNGSKGY
jgi:hypothetical protein